jgi:hypothetical protein
MLLASRHTSTAATDGEAVKAVLSSNMPGVGSIHGFGCIFVPSSGWDAEDTGLEIKDNTSLLRDELACLLMLLARSRDVFDGLGDHAPSVRVSPAPCFGSH